MQTTTESQNGQHPQTGEMVTITVNGNPVTIHRGHQTVSAIKTAAGVPQAYELSFVGAEDPLPDDGAVTIKGDEKFIAYPRDATSS